MDRIAVLPRPRKAADLIPQAITQRSLTILLPDSTIENPFRCGCHSGNRCHVLRSWTTLILVRPAKLNPFDWQTSAEVKQARSFWSVKLVRGKACGCKSSLIEARLKFPERLHHVAVKENPTIATNLR